MRTLYRVILFIFTTLVITNLDAQSGLCDSITPFYVVDMTGQPNGTYISPPDIREGNCCGTSHPVRCIEFEITLDPNAVGLQFDIYSGAAPSGSLFYQVNCGPEVPVGSIICLNGVGPHTLTFCKPGSNQNEYAITSIPGVTNSETSLTAEGCSTELYVSGYEDSTIVWNEISSGNYMYNSNLSCLNGCDTTTFTATANMPDSIIVEVCGYLQAGACMPTNIYRCDTLVVDIYDPLDIIVDSLILPSCENAFTYNVAPAVLFGSGAYAYYWYDSLDGFGNLISTDSTLSINASGEYSLVVIDSLFPDCSRDTMNVQLSYPIVFENNGGDTTVCFNDYFDVMPVLSNLSWDWYLDDSLACNACASFGWNVTDSVNLEIIPLDSASCWDTININVFPAPVYSFNQQVEICEGEMFILPSGLTVDTAGTYVDSFTTSLGCDSLWTTQVNVLPSYNFNQTVDICDNQNFTLPSGLVVSSAGTYVDSFTSVNACDSVWTTILQVNPSYAFNQNVAICDGDSFTLPSGLVTGTAGTYVDSFTSVYGCDSTWTTQLSVNPTYNLNQSPTICANESFTLPSGIVVSTAGVYVDSFSSSYGCDSIWTTQLTVLPAFSFSQSVSICSNESFTLPSGNVVNSAGTYVDTLASINGCDSVWTTTIQVNPSYAFNQNVAICDGDSFTLPSGLLRGTAGTYVDSFTSVYGCDSIWTTQLSVNPIYNLNQNPTICANESFTLPSGIVVSTAGVYVDSFSSSYACDSIWTTQLTVLPAFSFSQSVSICSNENFSLPSGNVVNSAGTYVDTLASINGCDSVWTTTIQVNPSYAFNQNVAICDGDSFTLPSGLVTGSAGTYVDSFTSVYGCDSIWTTQLSVNPTYNLNQSPVICANESFTLPSGIVVSTTGVYVDSFSSSYACDSIWTTQLTVLSTFSFSQSVSICSNESYTLPSGNVINNPGVYVDTLSASTGCDSVWTTTLTINQTYSNLQRITICANESFILPSGVSVNSPGIYVDTLSSAVGCDSIWTTDLSVNPSYSLSQNVTICSNENFTLPSGIIVNSPGMYVDSFTTILGCDSVWTTNLSVSPSYSFNQSATICSNEFFILPSGMPVNTSGVYMDTLVSSQGCDSIWTTQLTVNPSYSFDQSAAICEDEFFLLPSGVSVNLTGLYVDSFTSISGCDSIWTTDLIVYPNYSFTQNLGLCSGDSLMLPSGVWTNTAGQYVDSFASSTGCDSIWITTVEMYQPVITQIQESFCSGSNATINGVVYNQAGDYTDTLQSVHGCDSILAISIIVNKNYAIEIDTNICANESIEIDGMSYNESGTYIIQLATAWGCDSIITLHLEVSPTPTVFAGEDFSVYPNTLFYLQASDFPSDLASITWNDGDTTICSYCIGFSTSTETSKTYTVTVVDSNSCKTSDDVEVDLIWECPTEDIKAPNIISPNGDGNNDYFHIENPGGRNVEFIRIYNRWGELVFESYDAQAKWDGTFRNQVCNPDVYVYYIKTVCVNGAEGIKKGNITILK